MQTIELTLFADYYQFYLQDDYPRFGDLSHAWTQEAIDRLIAVGDHVVGIGTVRNMDVQVRIVVDSKLPNLDSKAWDKINRASLVCDTGRIVIAGCTDYFPDATRLNIEPGMYDVLVGYRNLDSLSEDRMDGNDSYHIFLARHCISDA
jgi:hypothetical protein